MVRFVARRALQGVATLAVVALLAFVLARYVGDPVLMILGEQGDALAREQLRSSLGLDDPVQVQFGRFLWQAVHGDLGRSYRSGVPVFTLFAERVPATLELVGAATLLALAVGLPMGVLTALGRPRALRVVLDAISLVGVSVPTFLIGLLLMQVFAVHLRWLPAFGRSDLRSLVLPAITLAWFNVALIARLVRAEMQEALHASFVSAARARGIPTHRVHVVYVLGQALVPLLTVTGLQVGTLVAFSLVTESVFQWPGLGLLFVQAVATGDIPIITGYLMLVALLFTTINLVVDVLHAIVDPRLHATILDDVTREVRA